jgi:hypothetical protein
MPNELLKILRDIFKRRVYWLETPYFIYWFLFNQKQEELRNKDPKELPWTINQEQIAGTRHHA